MVGTRYFTIGYAQVKFLRELNKYPGYVPLGNVLVDFLGQYLGIMNIDHKSIASLFRKKLILAKGGFPSYSSPYVQKIVVYNDTTIQKFIKEKREIKINEKIVSFLDVVEDWFELKNASRKTKNS